MNQLSAIRRKLSTLVSKRMLPESYTIISDDCWGGQLQNQLKIPYTTPIAGLYIHTSDYINFIKNIRMPDAANLAFIASNEKFPVAVTPYATLYFMHYHSEQEAVEKFSRRFSRIDYNNIFFKIDFGKQSATSGDIEEWNSMKLPNSVAFYPPTVTQFVHNGVMIPEWVLDGAAMFDICRKHFDVFTWLREGRLEIKSTYRLLNFLLLDPTTARRMKKQIR